MITTFTMVWYVMNHGMVVASGGREFYEQSRCEQARIEMPRHTPEGYPVTTRCLRTKSKE